ncbi:MAG: transposase [Acidobacteria bacterium]|nr:transposase [Acidobacteriota bacterium]
MGERNITATESCATAERRGWFYAKAKRRIGWHREKAGTIEWRHEVLKDELAPGVLPCRRFGTDAAWLRLVVISHSVLTVLKRLALQAELQTARPKRLRFLIFHRAGRLIQHARRLVLRVVTRAVRLSVWIDARESCRCPLEPLRFEKKPCDPLWQYGP